MRDAAPFLFAASAALIVYVLAGYPLLLDWIARRKTRPIRKDSLLRSVSILMAVRDGAPWIRRKLESLLAADYPREQLQILVISDGSTDATDSIASEFARAGVGLLRIAASGKPVAITRGLAEATGEILVFTDVRQPVDPSSIRRLVACFADADVGVVSGELILDAGGSRAEAAVGFYWQYEKWIRKRQSAIDSVDGATGALYAMRRELAVPVPPQILLDDVYLPMAAFFRGYRVIFEESARVFDTTVPLRSEFRRKVRTLAGVWQLLVLYPRLLGPSNRMRFHFVSHKLGRLLLPLALVSAAAATLGLDGAWFWAAALPQVLLYGMAALDPWMPKWMKRGSSPARAFVVLMAAALCAMTVLVSPDRQYWKNATGPTVESEGLR